MAPLLAAALASNGGCRTGLTSKAKPAAVKSAVVQAPAAVQPAAHQAPAEASARRGRSPAPQAPIGNSPVELPPPPTDDGLAQPATIAPPASIAPQTTPPPQANPAAPGFELRKQPEPISAPRLLPPPSEDAADNADAPTVDQVVNSIRNNFPVIQEAAAKRIVASGEVLSATGAFDRKVDGFNNWQPLDFFENHWYQWKIERNTLWGGKVGAGYKLGRGSFEPWFLERETNDGGEISINITAPIGRDVEIDANRAELWRAQLEQGRIEPFVRSQVIKSVLEGKIVYWQWVAAGASQAIAAELLDLARTRNGFLERQVEEGEEARIKLVDNQRIVLSRTAKLVDAQRKLRKAAIKLSLFYRTPDGSPVLVPDGSAPDSFPPIDGDIDHPLDRDIELALGARPELAELEIIRQQLGIDLRQANNETRADVDGGLFFGQDFGNPTSSDNKSDFEIEATLAVSVPLERRKALGKVRQVRGKLAALQAKTRFASNKIVSEVQAARASLAAAALRVEQTTEAVRLARQIVDAEAELYRRGQSTLFNLNLREGQVAAAAVEQIAAEFDYFAAQAELDAARGVEEPLFP